MTNDRVPHGRLRLSEEMAEILEEALFTYVGTLFASKQDDDSPALRRRIHVALKLRRYVFNLQEEMGWDEETEGTTDPEGPEFREAEVGLR